MKVGKIQNFASAGGLPDQTGQSGKYLTTNGSSSSWGTVSAGASSWNLAAHWSQSMTKTNIGASFVNVYSQTNADGKSIFIDTNGKDSVKLTVNWNKVGSGTQTVEVIESGLSVQLVTMNVVSGYNVVTVVIPAGVADSQRKYYIRVKSSTSTDDPIFEGAAVYLK